MIRVIHSLARPTFFKVAVLTSLVAGAFLFVDANHTLSDQKKLRPFKVTHRPQSFAQNKLPHLSQRKITQATATPDALPLKTPLDTVYDMPVKKAQATLKTMVTRRKPTLVDETFQPQPPARAQKPKAPTLDWMDKAWAEVEEAEQSMESLRLALNFISPELPKLPVFDEPVVGVFVQNSFSELQDDLQALEHLEMSTQNFKAPQRKAPKPTLVTQPRRIVTNLGFPTPAQQVQMGEKNRGQGGFPALAIHEPEWTEPAAPTTEQESIPHLATTPLQSMETSAPLVAGQSEQVVVEPELVEAPPQRVASSQSKFEPPQLVQREVEEPPLESPEEMSLVPQEDVASPKEATAARAPVVVTMELEKNTASQVALAETVVGPTQERVGTPLQIMKIQKEGLLVAKAQVDEQASSHSTRSLVTGSDTDPLTRRLEDETLQEGFFMGEVEFDGGVQKWMDDHKAHLELYLRPQKMQDRQDIRAVDFDSKSQRFEFPNTLIDGPWVLSAYLFADDSIEPVIVMYPHLLYREDYKSLVHFQIGASELRAAQSGAHLLDERLVLNLTLFKAASSDPRKPEVISGARVSVMGFEGLSALESDSMGNVRVENLPPHSEIMVHVSAPGYYDTFETIPLGRMDDYVTLHLVEKDQVQTVTEWFTQNPQKTDRSLVVGRIFDPSTRAPQSGAQVGLSSREGRPLYFGSLPDKEANSTLFTGLFAFYNVMDSVRVIEREDRFGLLHFFRPQTASFVEFGRSGESKLVARLVDPYHKGLPTATVSLLGTPQKALEVEEGNVFEFEGIDFAPGVITVETSAPGYPLTWHTLRWNAQLPAKEQTLHMVHSDLLVEHAALAGVDDRVLSQTGSLLGGVSADLFEDESQCWKVVLKDVWGNRVGDESGPFDLKASSGSAQKSCVSAASSGYSYFGLEAGEYLLELVDRDKRVRRSHVVRVGEARLSIVVN